MKFEIVIDCDNDAFEPDGQAEIERILRVLAADLSDTGFKLDRNLFDANGNRVGFARFRR
jgi:hypothetical protein